MKLYKKLTIVNTILGIIASIIILFIYFFINSLIGIPLLGLFFGGIILNVFILLIISLAGIISIFYIKNTRILGIALIIYGILVLSTTVTNPIFIIFGIPGFILFVISGILALKEKQVIIKWDPKWKRIKLKYNRKINP